MSETGGEKEFEYDKKDPMLGLSAADLSGPKVT